MFIAKVAQQKTTMPITKVAWGKLMTHTPMVVKLKTMLPIAIKARLKMMPHIAVSAWWTTTPGKFHDNATYNNAPYCQSGAAEDSDTYCQSGAADNVAVCPRGGEAKDYTAYCHGGIAEVNAIVEAWQTTTQEC
jgi:hypothetical protein